MLRTMPNRQYQWHKHVNSENLSNLIKKSSSAPSKVHPDLVLGPLVEGLWVLTKSDALHDNHDILALLPSGAPVHQILRFIVERNLLLNIFLQFESKGFN